LFDKHKQFEDTEDKSNQNAYKEVKNLMQEVTNKKGFTLIELVIVLAIAALILAGVLIAVTGAQKSRRDTQRKDDAAKIVSYLEQYASNNSGNYPTGAARTGFDSTYITSNNLKDPSSGNTYTIAASTNVTAAPGTPGAIAYNINATCNGPVATTGAGNRKIAVVIGLEQGGSACFSN
jgi:prepilin-type N-terminal cleavage/methylation domain-containing protein